MATTKTLLLDDGYQLSYTILNPQDSDNKPLLLFIVGSVGLGAFYHRLATRLSSDFTCVYYDRRGYSSTPTPQTTQDEEEEVIQRQALDAAALLKHLTTTITTRKAYVFATSFGATIALDLLLSHPHRIQKALLHEPMLPTLLPPGLQKEKALASFRAMPQSSTPFALFAKDFLGAADSDAEKGNAFWSRTPPGNLRQAMREAVAVTVYQPEVERLRAVAGKLVLMAGIESRGLPVREMVEALAGVTGTRVEEIQGAHFSFVEMDKIPKAAEKIRRVLSGDERAKM